MAKRNYKIYANIGFIRQATQRYVVVLDTVTGSSFIRKDVILTNMWGKISSRNFVRDANKHNLHTSRTINIDVEIEKRVKIINFNVVEILATNILLEYNYCDRLIEAIKPRQCIVELDGGTNVPIILNTRGRSRKEVSLPESQRLPKGEKSSSTNI